MKPGLLFVICCLPMAACCQAEIKGPWAIECGASINSAFRATPAFNLRYISPRFRWSVEELTEEEEKRMDEFRNTRLMFELIYGPPIKVLGTSLNVQSRFLRYKRLSLDLYGGVKFFFVPGPDFVTIPYLKSGRELWYLNLGVLLQLNLGIIAPFADIGGDRIVTIGTQLNLHAIYRKPKKRYNLHTPTSRHR